MINFREFFRAYVEAALWSSCDDNEGYLDESIGVFEGNISLSCYLSMARDCKQFLDYAKDELNQLDYTCNEYTTSDLAGHDFWLTKEGHGAGFWDRGLGELGDKLTINAQSFSSSYLYIDDGGMLQIG